MATITTRAGKGSPLTNTEVDDNFTNLNTDKAELSGAAFTGNISTTGTLGIGTTSPQAPLHVIGDINLGKLGNINAANVEIASLNFYNTDTSGSAPNNAAIIRAYSHSATGSGGYLTFGTSFGGEAEGADATERMRIDSSGNVGIGTTSPDSLMHLSANTGATLTLESTDTAIAANEVIGEIDFYSNDASGIGAASRGSISLIAQDAAGAGSMLFKTSNASTASTEAMRIDSSGNVLVGKTDIASTVIGCQLLPTGGIYSVRDGNLAAVFDRKTSDGGLVEFRKDGSGVGSIGTIGGELYIQSDDVGLQFDASGNDIIPYGGGFKDATIDFGSSANRFKDIYRSGSTYSTSDRNKKQDIRDLTDAEARVATVAKGSLKAFRYIDSVEAKGDEANIHFGIIAQDLKAAFEAEGLNANDYQVFKTSTYTDDDGVEQTTYSICYENLLAFIIAAI